MMFCQYYESSYSSSPITLSHINYAALPKEQLIGLLNNIKILLNQRCFVKKFPPKKPEHSWENVSGGVPF